ncbi:MAG: hypothetical protein UT30_C0011G0051 [Candidatus Uhrbacteria bacterium GW2011_GWF2_39_13]|uniref:PrsW family intramembrane metalloprotease n=1 Tax=Candidatus Uhrbacteria bacterium GW2011_GWF2_39_13 TaxID=1618995 RepID=A0A0G0Q1B3_9BACT|nr:MAG: hypothetical protein UT30_C0011G0051 [Candidatus Uhrbacteria bacterium GW2011_GWF2_39_13]HAU66622.1 hypothetical protein [Candidatus Uhrbacteria bacterium]
MSTSFKNILDRFQKSTLLMMLGATIVFATFFIRNPSFVWIDLWFVFEIFILTLFTKTVSFRYGLQLFFQGILIAGLGSILFWNLVGLLGFHDTIFGETLIAVGEEILKFLPVFIPVFFVYRDKKNPFNFSDVLFLCVMCSAGFSLFEKSFWQGVSFPFTYGPHIGDLYFFSDALGIYVDGEKFGYVGHAAATGLIGMGAAIGLFLKNKQRTWWWIVPVFAFVWIVGEHALSNFYYVTGTTALLSFGGGMLTPWIFLVFLVFILRTDINNLRQFFVTHPQEQEVVKKSGKVFLDSLKAKKNWVDAGSAFSRNLRAANSLAWEESTKIQSK